MPSTTISVPGYWCGVVSVLGISSVNLKANHTLEDLFKWRRVAVRGPELELHVAAGAEVEQVVTIVWQQGYVRHALRMAPIEPFGQPQDGAQELDGSPQ